MAAAVDVKEMRESEEGSEVFQGRVGEDSHLASLRLAMLRNSLMSVICFGWIGEEMKGDP